MYPTKQQIEQEWQAILSELSDSPAKGVYQAAMEIDKNEQLKSECFSYAVELFNIVDISESKTSEVIQSQLGGFVARYHINNYKK